MKKKNAGAEWLNDCCIWMYRGVLGRNGNRKHQNGRTVESSGKKKIAELYPETPVSDGSAPFLGNDERLFQKELKTRKPWNCFTYDQLGHSLL